MFVCVRPRSAAVMDVTRTGRQEATECEDPPVPLITAI